MIGYAHVAFSSAHSKLGHPHHPPCRYLGNHFEIGVIARDDALIFNPLYNIDILLL